MELPLRRGRSRDRRELLPLHLPGMDGGCLETFLKHLGEAYADHRLVVVLDGAPRHTSKKIELPENVSLLALLLAYSPELNPVERWFQEFRRTLSNRIFETVELLQQALTKTLEAYWEEPRRLQGLTPGSLGGWKPSTHYDINALDRY